MCTSIDLNILHGQSGRKVRAQERDHLGNLCRLDQPVLRGFLAVVSIVLYTVIAFVAVSILIRIIVRHMQGVPDHTPETPPR